MTNTNLFPDANMLSIFPYDLTEGGGFTLHYMTLYSIIYGMEAKSVFEFGCGYSSQVILSALERTGGRLTTVEMRDIKDTGNNPELLESNKERWQYIQKHSHDALRQDIDGKQFDVVLHDGSHGTRTVIKDIRGIVKHMKQDAILLVHDTDHEALPNMKLAVRLGLFPYRYEMMTLPYGYGLTIVRLKSNFGNGKVSLHWKAKKHQV